MIAGICIGIGAGVWVIFTVVFNLIRRKKGTPSCGGTSACDGTCPACKRCPNEKKR